MVVVKARKSVSAVFFFCWPRAVRLVNLGIPFMPAPTFVDRVLASCVALSDAHALRG